MSKAVHAVRINDIVRVVASFYDLSPATIRGQSRERRHVRPRQIAYSLVREFTNASLPEIGRAFSGRDHTTAIHGIRKVGELMLTHPELADDVRKLRTMVANYKPAPFEIEAAAAVGNFAQGLHALQLRAAIAICFFIQRSEDGRALATPIHLAVGPVVPRRGAHMMRLAIFGPLMALLAVMLLAGAGVVWAVECVRAMFGGARRT